jgi:hypothetical protein
MAPLDTDAKQQVNMMQDRGTIPTVNSYGVITTSACILLCVRTDDRWVHALQFSPRDALDVAIQVQRNVEHTAQALLT